VEWHTGIKTTHSLEGCHDQNKNPSNFVLHLADISGMLKHTADNLTTSKTAIKLVESLFGRGDTLRTENFYNFLNFCCLLQKNLSSTNKQTNKQTPWSESTGELYRLSDRCFSAKWLPTFADKGCHLVSVTDPYGRILGFPDRSRYFSIK
jgi:hypothetical protein